MVPQMAAKMDAKKSFKRPIIFKRLTLHKSIKSQSTWIFYHGRHDRNGSLEQKFIRDEPIWNDVLEEVRLAHFSPCHFPDSARQIFFLGSMNKTIFAVIEQP